MMRILLDECVDERLRHFFFEHDCQTARFAGLAGLKNGQLLNNAETAGFDVIVTVDQSIPYQQSLEHRNIALLILCSPTNRLIDLEQTIPDGLAALLSIQPGEVRRVP